jgi:putative serine protease PepD
MSESPPPVRSASNRAYLGVQAGDVSSDGAVVLKVDPGGPADSARIQVGDIITAVNGHSVPDASALQVTIASMAPRSPASLTIDRNGTTMMVHVMLGTLPEF